jgi:hypothetical protein
VTSLDAWQQWINEVQKITCEFVQNDEHLGMLMLDGSHRYWDQCFENGLTPQQALDKFIKQLSGGRI